jgi:hypothetical protein
MTRSILSRGLVALASAALMVGISACGGATEGDLPETKPATPEQVQSDQAKINMMKGQYKGAPGVPLR